MLQSSCVQKKLALLAFVLLAATTHGQPQRPTIPELLAQGSSGSTTTAPSGKAPTVTELLRDAHVVVRGIVGEPESYLSDDERDVYTDYPLIDPVFLYHAGAAMLPTPGTDIVTVTQLGGTVTLGHLSFTQKELGLLPLAPGTEGLFVLKRIGEKYHIVRTYYGAFGISGGRVRPLTSREDFAPEYRDAPVGQVVADLAAQLAVLHR